MQRNQAISKASKFLGRKYDVKTGGTAKKIKKKSKNNPQLNRARLNQIVADFYQRGVDPKDLDLEKIDWSVSYQNIRSQVQELLDKRGADKFSNRRQSERKASMDYAAKKESDMLMTIADVRHSRRPAHSRYTDETKEADRKFGRLTDESFEKWSKDPNKYDIEGIDGKQEKGSQQPLPLRRNSMIEDMRMSDAEQSKGFMEDPGASVNAGELLDKDLGISGSDKLDFKDSRSKKQVKQDNRGGTAERSTQKGLREQGFSSKKSEKTLGNWDGVI